MRFDYHLSRRCFGCAGDRDNCPLWNESLKRFRAIATRFAPESTCRIYCLSLVRQVLRVGYRPVECSLIFLTISVMSDIVIKTERPRVEELFAPYRLQIGRDFDGYRNHVYRTITYAMHFLNNASEYESLVETAFVYHDIGLWTGLMQRWVWFARG